MKNLGEKLQEARTAKGLSLRDVADATRLRASVIEQMESGNFDFDLPGIYKRGFLRIYAAFLKLDVDQILAEYSLEYNPSEDSKKKKAQPRMSVREAAAPEPVSMVSRYEEPEEEPDARESSDDAAVQYMKLGGIFVGVLLAVLVIIAIVVSLVKGDAPKENPDIAMNSDIATQPAPVQKEFVLKVSALGDTYMTLYYEDAPTQPLFGGAFNAGEVKEFKSVKPIRIRVTDAEKIQVEKNAKVLDLKGAKGPKIFNVSGK